MAAKIVAVISTLASLAAAEPGYGGVALHPYGGYGYHGYGYGKREAEPGYGAIAYHPYGGSSSVYRTTQGLTGYGYGGYGYGGYYGKRSADAEPGYATGYTYRTTQGLTGYGGYGYGGYGYGGYGYGGYYGGASSYVHQSRPYYHGSYGYGINHYGKRSADAGYYGYGVAGSYQQVNRPYSAYGLSVAHPY